MEKNYFKSVQLQKIRQLQMLKIASVKMQMRENIQQNHKNCDMAVSDDESFEKYKNYLEESLGFCDISPPPRPMNPYSMFIFERSCQERIKGKVIDREFNQQLNQQWKDLPLNKKQYYYKVYQVRKRQRSELLFQYQLFRSHRKSPTAYVCFFRKKFKVLNENQEKNSDPHYKKLTSAEITKIISSEWKLLPNEVKEKYKKEAEELKQRKNWSFDEKKEIAESYERKVNEFKQDLLDDKNKVMEKYGMTKKDKKRMNKMNKAIQKSVSALQEYEQKMESKKNEDRQIPKKEVETKKQVKIEGKIEQNILKKEIKDEQDDKKQKKPKKKKVEQVKDEVKIEIDKSKQKQKKKNQPQNKKIEKIQNKNKEKQDAEVKNSIKKKFVPPKTKRIMKVLPSKPQRVFKQKEKKSMRIRAVRMGKKQVRPNNFRRKVTIQQPENDETQKRVTRSQAKQLGQGDKNESQK